MYVLLKNFTQFNQILHSHLIINVLRIATAEAEYFKLCCFYYYLIHLKRDNSSHVVSCLLLYNWDTCAQFQIKNIKHIHDKLFYIEFCLDCMFNNTTQDGWKYLCFRQRRQGSFMEEVLPFATFLDQGRKR